MRRSMLIRTTSTDALQVLQSMKSKERAGLTPVQLRKKAAEFASNTVAKQSESFRRYGVMGDFEKPYLTLQPEYEAAQIEVGGSVGRGVLVLACCMYRGNRNTQRTFAGRCLRPDLILGDQI